MTGVSWEHASLHNGRNSLCHWFNNKMLDTFLRFWSILTWKNVNFCKMLKYWENKSPLGTTYRINFEKGNVMRISWTKFTLQSKIFDTKLIVCDHLHILFMTHPVCEGLKFIYQDTVTKEDLKMLHRTTDKLRFKNHYSSLHPTGYFYDKFYVEALLQPRKINSNK